MKKTAVKFTAILIASLMFLPAISVSAETTTQGSKLYNFLNKQQQRVQNLQQIQQMKPAIAEKKDTIKKNHETNQALRKEILQKKNEVKAIYKDIKQNKKQLSSDDLSKIDAQLKVIQIQTDALAATKGTIKQEFQLAKSSIKSKNFNDALAHLDKIISIQNTRTDGLTKLRGDMDSLIGILNASSESSTSTSVQSDSGAKL